MRVCVHVCANISVCSCLCPYGLCMRIEFVFVYAEANLLKHASIWAVCESICFVCVCVCVSV